MIHEAHAAAIDSPRTVIDRYFRAMQAGRTALDELLAVFAHDAVYVEPFSGHARTHRGIRAIRDAFEGSWSDRPPGIELTVTRIELDDDEVRSEWVCTSPVFASPVRGVDRCQVRNGRIVRLEVELYTRLD